MKFKACNQNQILLLPPSFQDFLGESHEAVILNEFMQELDTSAIEQSYRNERGGRSAYHPAMILSVLVYGYMNGIFSSRKIAKRLSQDLAFMYLAGNERPDFRTLVRFRREKGAQLEGVFAAVIQRARNLGLVSFGTCSLDGTKIRANASKDKNYRKDDLERNIRTMIEEAERIDAEEDALFGEENEDAEDPALKTKEGREQRKKVLREKRKHAEAALAKIGPQGQVNLTDPDAKLMKLKQGHGFANAYNVQTITENGIILSSSIVANSADQGTLIPSVEKLGELHGQTPEKLLADKGYSSEDNYAFCEATGIDAYIPPHTEPRDLSGWRYDKRKDAYRDPRGRVYLFKQHLRRRDGTAKRGRPPKAEAESRLYKTTKYEYWNRRTGKKRYLSYPACGSDTPRSRKRSSLPSAGSCCTRSACMMWKECSPTSRKISDLRRSF